MKKVNFLLSFCLLAISSTLLAQGFYVQPSLSYHLPATKEVVGFEVTASAANNTASPVYSSFGKGLDLGLELGYFINKNVAFNLGLDYVAGSEGLVEESSFPDLEQSDKSTSRNRRLTLSPGVTIDAGMDKFSPFARFGLLIPATGQTDGTRNSTSCGNVVGESFCNIVPELQDFESFEATSVTKGAFSLGFTSSIGARYQINEMVSVFGAFTYNGLRIKRKSYEVTKAEVTNTMGVVEDVRGLLSLGGAYVYTEYKDNIDQEDLAAYQASAGAEYGTKEFPAWAPSEAANFSTFGIGIGARFTFGASSAE